MLLADEGTFVVSKTFSSKIIRTISNAKITLEIHWKWFPTGLNDNDPT